MLCYLLPLFKSPNDCYESYVMDKEADAQMVKYICNSTNLVSGIAGIHSSTNGA